jgi:hypothetical protein
MYERHCQALGQGVLTEADVEATNQTLRRLERFWASSIDFSPHMGEDLVTSAA